MSAGPLFIGGGIVLTALCLVFCYSLCLQAKGKPARYATGYLTIIGAADDVWLVIGGKRKRYDRMYCGICKARLGTHYATISDGVVELSGQFDFNDGFDLEADMQNFSLSIKEAERNTSLDWRFVFFSILLIGFGIVALWMMILMRN